MHLFYLLGERRNEEIFLDIATLKEANCPPKLEDLIIVGKQIPWSHFYETSEISFYQLFLHYQQLLKQQKTDIIHTLLSEYQVKQIEGSNRIIIQPIPKMLIKK